MDIKSKRAEKTKNYIIPIIVIIITIMILPAYSSCKEINPSGYTIKLPKAPETWISLLGEPNWRVEWLDPGGNKQAADISCFDSLEIEIPVTWANPVTAWPYWPDYSLIPGFFKPAGAIFPYDIEDGCLSLNWETGPDTVFYWEMAYANEQNYSRIPANFDWPRFRELFKAESLRGEVREDPWLVNWRSAAEKTVAGNFDTRRLVPEATELKTIPENLPDRQSSMEARLLWFGTSPFVKPLIFNEGEPAVFPIRPGINVWISAAGILRVNGNIWVFTEMKN